MKTRILILFLALCALSPGLIAQNEDETPPAPAEPAEPAAEEAPAPPPETPPPADSPEAPEPAPGPKPADPPADPPAAATDPPVTPPAPAPVPATPPAAADDPLAAPSNVAAPPAEAEKSESGLAWIVLQPGSGTSKPELTEVVEVHYTGWKSSDGKMFDSSVQRGTPTSFPVNGVIEGWTEGLQLMVEGEKRRFWIPADLAYGDDEDSERPTGQLCFDVELLRILRVPPTPEDLTAAPGDAEVTASGLATKVITPGTGVAKPKPLDNVRVHYTYWTSDGKMGESSLQQGRAATYPLKRTVPGFTEALQMMVEGETRRMWIPPALGYGEQPPEGAPKGMLIFEVELLEIYQTASQTLPPRPPVPPTP